MDVQVIKEAADIGAAGIMVSTVAGWLPAAAALVTIVWTSIRIYEWCKGKKLIKKPSPAAKKTPIRRKKQVAKK